MNSSSAPPGTDDLFTVSAGGFSATVDAFARDDRAQTLWFLSMVGSQTALKAIWAALLKQPPEPAHLVRGADGTALSGGYQRCMVPPHTVGTWTTKIVRLPASGGWHAIVYTKWAEFSHDSDSFLLLAGDERDAPALHHRFLDRRSPLPLHRTWAGWLWDRGYRNRRDRTASVFRNRRVPLSARRRAAQGGLVRGRGIRSGDPGGWRRRRSAWIERSGRPGGEAGVARSETSPRGRASRPTAPHAATAGTTPRRTFAHQGNRSSTGPQQTPSDTQAR